MKEYYISIGGQQQGSYPEASVQQMLAAGQIQPTALCWCQGMTEWQPVHSVFPVPSAAPPVPPVAPAMPTGKPDNNMVMAILATLLCCWPFGIVAIVKSSSVDTLWYAGHHAEALRAVQESKQFCKYALIAGLVVSVLYLVVTMSPLGR